MSFICPVLILVSLFDQKWLLGGYFLLVWFYIAAVGQSIHKDKTYEELRRGGLTHEANVRPSSDSRRDLAELSRVVLHVSFCIGVTFSIVLINRGSRWSIGIVSGIGAALIATIVLLLAFARRETTASGGGQ